MRAQVKQVHEYWNQPAQTTAWHTYGAPEGTSAAVLTPSAVL
jgi:hypothetical protein